MQSNNPSIKLENFSLMNENSVIYMAENMIRKKIAGKNVLVPGNYMTKFVDDTTATITSYTGKGFYGATGMEFIGDDKFWVDAKGNVWCSYGATGQKIKNIAVGGSNCDMKALGTGKNDPILFTSRDYVGIIHRGQATGGSATSLEDTGVNFTLGEFKAENNHGGLAAGDFCYNITQNKRFSIDNSGIAAQALTVTAVDGGTFAAGDRYAIVNENWADLDDGQQATYGKQFCEFKGQNLILNGDWIANLDDSKVYTANYQFIEKDWVGKTLASNGNTLAVGANKNGRGKLYFWEIGLSGWKNILQTEEEIQSIIPYKNYFIFVSGNALYTTDGYNISDPIPFPNCDLMSAVTVIPTGMKVIKDKVIINITIPSTGSESTTPHNRNVSGIYIYDIPSGDFTYSPFEPIGGVTSSKTGYTSFGEGVFFNPVNNDIYLSFNNGDYNQYGFTSSYTLASFFLNKGNCSGTIITAPIQLPNNTTIKKIEVNTIGELEQYSADSRPGYTMDVKLSDCSRPLWKYAAVLEDATSKSSFKISASYNGAEVGDEVFFRNGWNGYLRRAITDISLAAGVYTITLDTALPNLQKAESTVNILPFQRYGMTPITVTSPTSTNEFNPTFTGDNIMLELTITGTNNKQIPAIQNIIIYLQ